ncbi:NADH pyrophosphatase [Aureimonas sp. SA4125]|uniref:NAD(+) diphosphatase n=1 Tax=Aureimonas sp. SA4125 TaxID=2826993 RepID=UPI001CC6889C|nr:NAD(+) diphosphatase [Aureimonas sp. SA4125]BDA82673.1 NADH pyrophosphatase [Aureimonas sp. SA4125]
MTRIDPILPRPQDLAMGFAGNLLTRDGENRTEETLATALAAAAAKVYLTLDGEWLFRDADGMADPGFDVATALAHAEADGDSVLLGHTPDGSARLAMRAATLPEGVRSLALRPLATSGLLDSDTEGQLGQAEHFLAWHRRSRFCGRCGTVTLAEAAGYRRRCPNCGDVHFPRTDPVSIMLIHDGKGRCILGRSARFPDKMWSCLAGFIEPGETLEDAVRRETLEEAGVSVGPVDYFASQPWPFPGSLMIGCLALATSTEIVFDTVELEACRWFERDEVQAMLDETHPDGLTAPKSFAIAHHLVRAFVETLP